MTRTYESIFIVRPDLTGDAYTAVIDKFKGVLTDQGASIIKVDEWGVRKLAYTVKKQNRGSYVLVIFEADPKVILEYERRLRLDESIIKFINIHLEKGFVLPAVAVEAVATTAAEEPAEDDLLVNAEEAAEENA
ncbi:MAG: 30S ribosomal protein S6 [Deltaproteobacteria bacterium HGW-Deltaproteobacteria-4]|nr:MAG: 30S ribosomal protein S6 [Deltaproteobacteria bacterium HGW-Deltaproteobacteria-4]